MDRPNLDRTLAWKRNEISFQATPMAAAVEEMNRYSRTQITLSKGMGLEGLDVSGVFKTGDSLAFINAVSMVHGLKVRKVDGRLEVEKGG